MNKMTYLVPAALCLALSLPVQGNKSEAYTTDEPDTLVADTVEADYSEDDDWAGVDGDDTAVDSINNDSVNNDPEDFCTYDDDLLTAYDTKSADYSLQYHKNFDDNITFSATLFTPDGENSTGVKKGSGYNTMVSHIFAAMLDPKDAEKVLPDILHELGEDEEEDNKKVEDAINPSHYKVEGLPEAIDIMNHLMTPEQFEGFLWGNIMKYAYRFGRKGDKGETAGKIAWYANQLKAVEDWMKENET